MHQKRLTEKVINHFRKDMRDIGLFTGSPFLSGSHLELGIATESYIYKDEKEIVDDFKTYISVGFDKLTKGSNMNFHIEKYKEIERFHNVELSIEEGDNLFICHMSVPGALNYPVTNLRDMVNGVKILTEIKNWAYNHGLISKEYSDSKNTTNSTYILKKEVWES